MSIEFYQTPMGNEFFRKQLPELIKALNRVADSRQMSKELPSFNGEVSNTAFVCYRENSEELQKEMPAVSDMVTECGFAEVQAWVDAQLKKAEEEEYCLLDDYEKLDFISKLLMGQECEMKLYNKGDECSPCYITLTVRIFPISPGIYPKASMETLGKLAEMLTDEDKTEAFAEVLKREMATDTENPSRMGHYMAKAIIEGNIEDFLVAICGWTSKTLVEFTEKKLLEDRENITDRSNEDESQN